MGPVQRQNLGETLLAANLIDDVQMQIALAEERQTGEKVLRTLEVHEAIQGTER